MTPRLSAPPLRPPGAGLLAWFVAECCANDLIDIIRVGDLAIEVARNC